MKIRNLKLALFGAVIISLMSCNDSLSEVGMSVKPDNDKQTIETKSLKIGALSLPVDSIFLKREEFLLGKYSHSKYGSLEASYFTEFYYPEFYKFKPQAKIDSVNMRMSISAWEGDSLTPMTISAYRVVKNLPEKFYTNINPYDYIDKEPIGKHDYQISSLSTIKTERGVIKFVKLNLPISIGQEILDNKDNIKDTESLKKHLKGVYVENDGLGNLLTVNISSIEVYYNYLDKGGSSTKADTVRKDVLMLSSTPEVLRMNRIKDITPSFMLNDPSKAYVKSPTGVCAEILFPQSKHDNKSRALNLAEFSLNSEPLLDDGLYPSSRLLLIHKDSVTSFFFNKKLPDNVTSFLGDFNLKSKSYKFGNISSLFNHYQINSPQKNELEFVVIPVRVSFSQDQSGRQIATSVSHEVFPRVTPILIDEENMKIKMVYSEF